MVKWRIYLSVCIEHLTLTPTASFSHPHSDPTSCTVALCVTALNFSPGGHFPCPASSLLASSSKCACAHSPFCTKT
ncbi:hypothetical protein XELAEV_18045042mg [Xenopus laevis]|uniref:Uncharacterized protein n=1 Tax=Xenopus laevis TaxID=8355 RepID=A0A974H4B4_XENLA|nr:hypothetical protein XELAEV_18045042mg [Xenopus laevis]